MTKSFLCPHCRGVVNPRDKIVLTIQYQNKRGLILLSPRPGDYQSFWDESFDKDVKLGEPVDFYCPICNADLKSAASEKLVELVIVKSGEKDGKALFSRVLGEHATFVLEGDKLVPYGRDANRFENLNFADGESFW